MRKPTALPEDRCSVVTPTATERKNLLAGRIRGNSGVAAIGGLETEATSHTWPEKSMYCQSSLSAVWYCMSAYGGRSPFSCRAIARIITSNFVSSVASAKSSGPMPSARARCPA